MHGKKEGSKNTMSFPIGSKFRYDFPTFTNSGRLRLIHSPIFDTYEEAEHWGRNVDGGASFHPVRIKVKSPESKIFRNTAKAKKGRESA
jgi:hypothetical protein